VESKNRFRSNLGTRFISFYSRIDNFKNFKRIVFLKWTIFLRGIGNNYLLFIDFRVPFLQYARGYISREIAHRRTDGFFKNVL
jgi:hypothetical protein